MCANQHKNATASARRGKIANAQTVLYSVVLGQPRCRIYSDDRDEALMQ
jgi:hypothetical protein